MDIQYRLITISSPKNGMFIQTDNVGAQLASVKISNKKGRKIEIMNQGLLDPQHSAYGKTAPNLVMTPGPAAKFDKKLRTPATNYKGEEMPVIKHEVDGKNVDAVAFKFNNYPTIATQHGWSQYIDYSLRAGGEESDNYYILQNNEDTLSPFKYRHYVCCSIEKDGTIKYVTELNNTSKYPIPGGLGWHPVFKLHDDTHRYVAVFEDVIKGDESCEVCNGYEVDCTQVIENGSIKFKGLKSATVALYYETKKGTRIPYLKVSCECPVWVLWGKGDGFAIEPWNTDKTSVYQNITNQNDISFLEDKGYKVLQPGKSTLLVTSVKVCDEYVNNKDIINLQSKNKHQDDDQSSL